MRTIVTPGDVVAEKAIAVRNTFVQSGKTYSKILGIYDESAKEIIALEGAWDPRVEDSVVGIISEVRNKVYIVDLSYFGRALLIAGKYDRVEFETSNIVNAMIKDIEGKSTIILTDARLLEGGTVIEIKPKKIPRVIGKKSTMIKQIADATGSRIIVGMNGLIWICGGNVALAQEALMKVEREAHMSGLTETIKTFLDERK